MDKTYVRDSDISWLNDKWLYDIFHPYVHHANREAGWNWKWDFSESFQFTVYHGRKENGGFYGWHADGSSDFLSMYKPAIKVKEGFSYNSGNNSEWETVESLKNLVENYKINLDEKL